MKCVLGSKIFEWLLLQIKAGFQQFIGKLLFKANESVHKSELILLKFDLFQ